MSPLQRYVLGQNLMNDREFAKLPPTGSKLNPRFKVKHSGTELRIYTRDSRCEPTVTSSAALFIKFYPCGNTVLPLVEEHAPQGVLHGLLHITVIKYYQRRLSSQL